MQFGFEVVAGTRRTAATWFEEVSDEVWHIEFEGVGEGVVRQNFDGDDKPSGFEYDAFRYDDLPARHEGEASSLAEAKRIAEEYVQGGQMAMATRRQAGTPAPAGSRLEKVGDEWVLYHPNGREIARSQDKALLEDYRDQRESAKSKRPSTDEPQQVPMRPQQAIRQSLSADQKKVRRQMSRKTAARNNARCQDCQNTFVSYGGDGCPKCGSLNLLIRCHYCNKVATDVAGDRDVCDDHYDSHYNASLTTKESRMSARREAELLQAMAVASLDDQRRIAIELADLRGQRSASRQADRDLDLADTVVRAHLTPVAPYVPHTASTDWVGEDVQVYSGDPTLEVKSAATVWFNKTSAALREDSEEFAMQAEGMALRTAGRYGEQFDHAHRSFMDHVAHLYAKVALTADPSGQGQSTITDYDTKTDQDPLFAEDWDGEKGTGSEIGSGVHPEPVGIAENKGTGGGTAGDDVDDDSTSMATPDKGPYTPTSSRRQAATDLDDPPFGEMQPLVDYQETRGDDLSEPDAATLLAMDPEEFDAWMDREASRKKAAFRARKVASEGQTCSVCGDAIAKDPSGEDPSTYHHDNGEKHDHEAKPSGGDSKESRRKQASSVRTVKCRSCGNTWDTDPSVDDDPCEKCGSKDIDGSLQNGENGGPKKDASRKTAGEEVRVLSIPMCDVHRFSMGVSNVPAKYDSRLPGLGGSWGNVCEDCFQAYGPGTLGTGNAQRLVESAKTAADDRSVDENGSARAESGLPQVEVGGPNDKSMYDDGSGPKPTDDPNVPSGAADVPLDKSSAFDNTSLDVVAAFRRRVQANLRNSR